MQDGSVTTPWCSAVTQVSARLSADITAVRRHLHANPELSMQEFATTKYLAERVESLGIAAAITDQRIGLTSDWQSQQAESSQRRIGLRGDIDALPIDTVCTEQYASRSEGVMHACGHDAHASMVWGALAILHELDHRRALPWPVAVRAIFQPAEETSDGGPLMIAAGALQGLSSVLALHVDPTLSVGKVAGRAGPFTAACDCFDVEFIGRAGHSARPHLSIDAVAAAASWIGEMYARVPRVHDCRDPAVVSVGTIQGGSAANIVAGQTHLSGTIRTFSESARAAIMQEMRNVA
ncbi:MAG: amidohydrolase, partial [Aureliella sp.]